MRFGLDQTEAELKEFAHHRLPGPSVSCAV